MSTGWHIATILSWLALSFFMSGMESGVQALSPMRIRHWVRTGRPGARALQGYLERPENFLWTILVGNTLANFAVTVLLVTDLHARLGGSPWMFWPAFGVLCGGLYVVCDLLPKTLFRRFPNWICLHLVLPFRAVHFALSPLVALTEQFARTVLHVTRGSAFTGRLFGNRDEFRALMQEEAGVLSKTEQNLINRILDLQNATLARLAVPIDAMVAVDVDTPVSRILAICQEHQVSRVPVWQGVGTRRRIVGVVRLSDLLYARSAPEGNAQAHLRPAVFLDESTRLDEALRRLQRGGDQFAVVVGPDGRERGLVTLWDLLRAMFGGGRS
jgi:CBS domain containing-hemolysin-like protein